MINELPLILAGKCLLFSAIGTTGCTVSVSIRNNRPLTTESMGVPINPYEFQECQKTTELRD